MHLFSLIQGDYSKHPCLLTDLVCERDFKINITLCTIIAERDFKINITLCTIIADT